MSETKQTGRRKKTSASGTQTRRTQKSQQTKTRQTKTKAQLQPQENGIGEEIALVVLLVLSAFLFISNFGVGGVVGSFVSGVLYGCFGLFAYVVPVLMLLVILFSLANKESLLAKIKVVGVILACLDLASCFHLAVMGKIDSTKVADIYAYCSGHRGGGGVVGGLLANFLHNVFGFAGACLVLAGVLVICMVMITGKSFVKVMSRGSQKAYESARDDMVRRRQVSDQRREQRREQKEEQKKQRLEKKVSGVGADLLIPKTEGNGLQEVEVEPKVQEMPATPENARMPEETIIGEDFTFPVHEVEPQVMKEEPEFQESARETGGLTEIGFNEDDLLKNALSRRELEAEKAREAREKEAAEKTMPSTEELPQPEESRQETPAPAVSWTEAAQPAAPVYQFPPLSLLKAPEKGKQPKEGKAWLQETAGQLQQIMEDFGVNATVTNVSRGPAVTRYEVQPAHGVKVSKIVALADDIKLNLAVPDVRIEAPIPGKAAVGIEVPNKENSMVMFRELVESEEFKKHKSKLAFAVGKDIGGKIMVSDIAKMPHLLIAGATGSGKSVCINTLIMSILYKARPDEVKLIMVDPKVVELSAYNGIPHLLIPVVTDPKKAAGALNWAVTEMMGRYNRFAELNVRNIQGYNEKIDSIADIEDENKPEKMPQIVIIVDELADLMMVSPGEVEDAICRLAQLARAAGIHLIIATQRPSVNVITGLIKANMPSRIAFAVSSGVDSRTILDMNGAEKLLGKGDMLFSPYGIPKPLRVQGAFVSDAEVGAVVEFLSSQNCETAGNKEDMEARMKQMQTAMESAAVPEAAGGGNDRDVLFVEAGKFIIEKDKASIGMLQRWFKIGFNRAARIMDQLADAGVVGEEEGTKPRKVLMSMEQFEQYIEEY